MTNQLLTLWRLEADDEKGFGKPQKAVIAFAGAVSLIPLLNTASIREDVLDLHSGISYHFFCRQAKLPVGTVYIARYEKKGSAWKAADMGHEEDLFAAAFAGSHYLKEEEDDFANGCLYTLERAVNTFLMDESEDTWGQMCLQLYNALLNNACIYLNSYEEDMKRNGMRLMFTSKKAKERVSTASDKVLPLELLIRDIAEDDAASKGLSIMSDNGWNIMVTLPKEAVQEIYRLYLMEVSGS